jgi:hypothetical protein
MSEVLTPFSEWKCVISRGYFYYVVDYVVRRHDVANQKTAK